MTRLGGLGQPFFRRVRWTRALVAWHQIKIIVLSAGGKRRRQKGRRGALLGSIPEPECEHAWGQANWPLHLRRLCLLTSSSVLSDPGECGPVGVAAASPHLALALEDGKSKVQWVCGTGLFCSSAM